MKPFCLALTALLVCSTSTSTLAEGDPTMRIRPLEMSEWNPKILNKIKSIGRVRMSQNNGEESDADGDERPRLPGMLKTVAHHPDLLDPFLDFATVISHNGALSRRESELLALRASWNCQSQFEWGHHVEYALNAGLSKEEIARIPFGPSADGWSATDRMLLEAADELHASQHVSDEVWSRIAAEYSDKQLVEILFVVGQYTMLSMVVNSSGVELEPGYEPLPTIPPSD